MIAFEVTINDETKVIGGIEGISVLSSILTFRKASGKDDDLINTIDLSVGGLLHHGRNDDEHLDWIKRSLEVGDKITICIVETSHPTEPIKRRRQDPDLVEKAKRKYYENLKKEYGELGD